MQLFNVLSAIEEILAKSVDPETGEIGDEACAQLEALEVARDELALEVAAYLKGEQAEAEAVRSQAKRLAERAAKHEARAARLEQFLAEKVVPAGTKLKDARSELTWRKSKAVEITAEDDLPEEFFRYTRAPDKTAIRKRLDLKQDVPGAQLIERQNLVIR
jgi:hypothetical protein